MAEQYSAVPFKGISLVWDQAAAKGICTFEDADGSRREYEVEFDLRILFPDGTKLQIETPALNKRRRGR